MYGLRPRLSSLGTTPLVGCRGSQFTHTGNIFSNTSINQVLPPLASQNNNKLSEALNLLNFNISHIGTNNKPLFKYTNNLLNFKKIDPKL
ncbi:hypothetical protein SAMN05192553_104361 [Cyclobacterium xiamenense]|uniref:Uncharacterized protein n=1 Tax=Cyclobacterium xiamenense TaxID=1297121 RepID=A0A1H6ZDG0_9BACT|nr:hypothetical protein SAMN05192553_104361 [Cyclobacterium xiamenense]